LTRRRGEPVHGARAIGDGGADAAARRAGLRRGWPSWNRQGWRAVQSSRKQAGG
jgi:hypothetical protein